MTSLVLITGSSGHLGFRTLVLALEAGYRVVASVRRPEQADKISNRPSIRPYADKLSFVEVKDITAKGAFDDAIKDVTHVLHLASPLPAAKGEKVTRLSWRIMSRLLADC
jgi:uncharacterized protein YbjT (DUF2867 family)